MSIPKSSDVQQKKSDCCISEWLAKQAEKLKLSAGETLNEIELVIDEKNPPLAPQLSKLFDDDNKWTNLRKVRDHLGLVKDVLEKGVSDQSLTD